MASLPARIFVTWLYSGQILDYGRKTLLSVYVFADRTDFPSLRRDIMSEMSTFHGIPLKWHQVEPAVSSLPTCSALYRWCLDSFVHHRDQQYLEADSYESVPKEFLHGVICRLAAIEGGKRKKETCACSNPCNYHEHKNEEEWKRTCGQDRDAKPPRPEYLKIT